MQITRNRLETGRGPADWFTGDVYIDTIASPSNASRLGAAVVHFTPRARTAWHTHPHGFFEPGENHWHGAAPTRFMAHVAIQQADDEGNVVSWGEHVSDEQYAQAPSLDEGGR